MEVLTIGEALACFSPPASAAPGRAEGIYLRTVGGAESNTSIALARLGRSVGWFSRVGTDPLGDYIMSVLEAEGVDLSAVVRCRRQTGVMLKERIGPHDTRVFYYRSESAAASLTADDLPAALIARVGLVHLTGVTMAIGEGPRGLALASMREAQRLGVEVSFDPNYRPQLLSEADARAVYRLALPHVTHLLCNEAEAMIISEADGIDDAIAFFRATGVRSVIVKRGAAGAIADLDGRRYDVPAYPAPHPVDPVGAGDAFNAGWIHARLLGLPEETGLALAAYVAAQVVQHPGDYEGFPSASDVEAWLAAHTR